jgi:spore germination cell wall hydrolase CwlJ-like protein
MDTTEYKQIFLKCTVLKLLALCIYGEARGEGELGKIAVGCVIRNRVNLSKSKSYYKIILKPVQFSCFNSDDENLKILLEYAATDNIHDIYFDKCMKVAELILSSKIGDITGGATNYFNPKRANPYWAKKMKKTVSIGKHDFYKD